MLGGSRMPYLDPAGGFASCIACCLNSVSAAYFCGAESVLYSVSKDVASFSVPSA